MKVHVYAYFNVLGGFFGVPQFVPIEPKDQVEIFKQGLPRAPKDVLQSIIEDDLYYLGVFDNEIGSFEPKKEFLIHCGEYAKKYLDAIILRESEKKEGSSDELKS